MGNDIITFQVMDNAELNFPFNEASEFIDMEDDESYTTSPAAIRQAYLENLNEFLATAVRSVRAVVWITVC